MRDYREDIRRDVQPALALSEAGIFVFSLKGKYLPGYQWTVTCSMLNQMSPALAKQLVETWLKSQYVASGVYFFKKQSDKDGHFHASFIRGDV